MWAERVAKALYPCATKMFPRGRWVNSLESVNEVTLLMNVHGIFRRSVPIWLNKMKGKGCILLPVVRTAAESRAVMNWEISSESDGEPEDSKQDAKNVEPGSAEDHAKQQQAAKQLALRNPMDEFVVMSVASTLGLHVMHRCEEVSGEEWDKKQFHECLQSGSLQSRMALAASGNLSTSAYEKASSLAHSSGCWKLLRPLGRTVRMASLAWGCIAMFMATLSQLCFQLWEKFPYKMWKLLVEPTEDMALEILGTPKCLLDSWSRRLLKRFNTVRKLLSGTLRAILIALGILLRWDTGRIECRHAQIRRLLRASRSSKWRILIRVAADFSLLRACLMSKLWRVKAHGKVAAKTRQKRRHGKYAGNLTGGGGLQRFLVGEYLRNHPCEGESKSERFLCANVYAQQVVDEGGPELERAKEGGAAGTVSHRAGGNSFQYRPRNRGSKRSLEDAVGDDQALLPLDKVARLDEERLELELQCIKDDFKSRKEKWDSEVEMRKAELGARSAQEHENMLEALQELKIDRVPDATTLPCSSEGFRFTFVRLPAPSLQIAKGILAGWHRDPKVQEVRRVLRKAWMHKCALIKQDSCWPIPASSDKFVRLSRCYTAGFCLCSGTGTDCKPGPELPLAFAKVILALVPKGSQLKQEFLAGNMFVVIYCIDEDEDYDVPENALFHVSYGNLNTHLFTMMKMQQHFEHAAGLMS